LRRAGIATNYYDLYTPTGSEINIYARQFAGKVGFKDEAIANASVAYIAKLYDQFAQAGDRAGQHHALVTALTMLNRAHWLGKQREADIFRSWLTEMLARQRPSPLGERL
jgi:hypothetical protein